MEKLTKLKLVTQTPFVDVYLTGGETDKCDGLVMTQNHMLRQEHSTPADKEYIIVFNEDGTLNALFKRLPQTLFPIPLEEESDVVLWDAIEEMWPDPEIDSAINPNDESPF